VILYSAPAAVAPVFQAASQKQSSVGGFVYKCSAVLKVSCSFLSRAGAKLVGKIEELGLNLNSGSSQSIKAFQVFETSSVGSLKK
jgi:hypothetical protein